MLCPQVPFSIGAGRWVGGRDTALLPAPSPTPHLRLCCNVLPGVRPSLPVRPQPPSASLSLAALELAPNLKVELFLW